MLSIRLARTGANKRPFYHIVVANQRSPLSGRYIERLGFFNPIAAGKEVRLQLDQARVTYWQQQGAQLSSRVQELVKSLNKVA
ncbi:MAG: 30S ribosomal protein S16 [Gammaproteobacteria bacterium]